jgi:single-strand DNA-binding protein
MAGWEQTVIIGNVGRDPETKFMPSGNGSVTSFTVAVTTRWTDRNSQEKKERVTWYSISAWNRLGEVAQQYVKKGTQIMVVGTVSARAYLGQDGQPRASLDLRADTFQLLGSRGDGTGAATGGDASYSGGGDYDQGYAPPARDMDDIPF